MRRTAGSVVCALAAVAMWASAPPASAAAPAPAPAAPEMSVLDLAAIQREIGKSKGRVVVVHFWASWCRPCLEELPHVDSFARKVRKQGVDVLSIALDQERSAARVARTLAERAPSLTHILARIDDPDAFVAGFGNGWEGQVPAMFGFDARGASFVSVIGEVAADDLDALARRLTSAAPPPARPAR